MSKFSIGDSVTCQYDEYSILEGGNTYIVEDISEYGDIKLDGVVGYYTTNRFELLSESQDAKNALYLLVKRFIKDQRIRCPESVYQQDCVIENAYELIEKTCEVVGYDEDE